VHLAVGVTRGEQAPELRGALVVEPFGGEREQLAAAVERVGLVAPVA
jgi:hypothetical protein